jgi:hypothetical protein
MIQPPSQDSFVRLEREFGGAVAAAEWARLLLGDGVVSVDLVQAVCNRRPYMSEWLMTGKAMAGRQVDPAIAASPERHDTPASMRQVGSRVERPVLGMPSGSSLSSNLAFSAELTEMVGGRVFFPKGVFRYKSHAEANAHQSACLARGMAQLAKERRHG